jgi:phage/conjugal plasmid C-4 type zinc finger TraR family protein
MAVGWARDGAVQDQIDASVEDAVARARSRLPRGESRERCEDCGEEIPEARRLAVPGVRRCVACQSEVDAEHVEHSLYNRRGSKGSQLK